MSGIEYNTLPLTEVLGANNTILVRTGAGFRRMRADVARGYLGGELVYTRNNAYNNNVPGATVTLGGLNVAWMTVDAVKNHSALHFQSVFAPSDPDRIESAILRLNNVVSHTRNVRINGQKSATPMEPDNSNLPADWPLTTEFVESSGGTGVVAFDVTDIVKEVLEDEPWQTGNNFNFLLRAIPLDTENTDIFSAAEAAGYDLVLKFSME